MAARFLSGAALALATACGPLLLQGAVHQLANSEISLDFDDEGRVTAISNRTTGHSYIAGAAHAPWRMFYRSGDALDLEIEPQDQPQPRVSISGSKLTIEYDSVRAQEAVRGRFRTLNVALILRATADGNRFVWTAEVRNREPDVEITEIWVPWLGGIRDLGLGREADVLYWPEAAGRRIVNPYDRLAKNIGVRSAAGAGPHLRMTYPWPASMSWFTFNNGTEGLYFGSHDKTLMTTTLNVMAHEGGTLSASVVKYPFVRTGETWTSEPVIVRVYKGDWHVAARFYREWAQTWMQRPDPPEWIRRSPGWTHPALGRKGQFGHISGSYADYPAMLRDSRSLGMNTLINFGWVKQGFDNRYPHYDPDDALGGEAALRKSLAEVRGMGGRTILYTQGQLIDPTTEFYRTKGQRITAKDVWGYEYREQYAFGAQGTFLHMMRNKYFGVACPSAPGWLDQLLSQYRMVKAHGAQGMIFDQLGGRPPYICFAADHDHTKPSLASGPGKIALMRSLRNAMKKDDPDFAFVIELGVDIYAGFADITHAWGPGFYPAPDSFGELFRYTFPEPVITHRSNFGDRKADYGHAFTLGLRWDANTSDTKNPQTGPYLARLTELCNANASLLLEGKFVDTEGFVCDNGNVAAHAFVAGNRLALALWNGSGAPQKVTVIAPGYQLDTVAWQDPRLNGQVQVMAPSDVALFNFKR